MRYLFDRSFFDEVIFDTEDRHIAIRNNRVRRRSKRGHYGDYGTKIPANWSDD